LSTFYLWSAVCNITLSLHFMTSLYTVCIYAAWPPINNNYWMRFLWYPESKTSHVFTSSLTASNTNHANLTWLPLEIMHRGHTRHDYPWPWVSLTRLLYNLQLDVTGADFENSLYAFGQSENRSWVQSVINWVIHITHAAYTKYLGACNSWTLKYFSITQLVD